MHIWTDLLIREGILLLILLALGVGPASFLSERFDAASRLALTPILGFCAGTCVTTTMLQFAPADQTYWMLIPLGLLSTGVACWRKLYLDSPSSGWRIGTRDLVQLLVVCVVVVGPLTYTLHEHHTVGPAAYTYTDVDNYVGEQDGAQTTSILKATNAWDQAQRTGTRFADLAQWDWSFFSSFNANPNATPLDANVNATLGLGATDTNSAFLIVLLLIGALGAFATVRYVTRSTTWMAVLAGALFGGPMFLELWFDTFQAAIIALGLVMPAAILGSEALRSHRNADLSLFALVLACFLADYPVLFPILIITVALILGWRALTIWRDGHQLWPLLPTAAASVGTVVILIIMFDNVNFVHSFGYYRKLLNNTVPLPRVSFHLPLEVLPGWLLQTREFWYMPSLGTDIKQVVLGGLVPLAFLSFIIIGIRRHRITLALVAFAAICALVAEYAYTSREACTYCAERDLLPLGPILAVLLALGLATLLATPKRWGRTLGLVGVGLVIVTVGQRTRVELTRFSDGSYFLDSANRSVLAGLPSNAKALQTEGYGETLSAQAENPLVYYLADEHARGRTSIVLGSNLNNAISYLDFGVTESPGPEFRPDYTYILTRFAGIQTDRRVVARSGGIALEQRTARLDITPYSGLEAPLERLDTSGMAWVQPGLPLQLYVTGSATHERVWAKLTFHSRTPVSVPSQTDVHFLQRGNSLTVCVPATGTGVVRGVVLRLTASAVNAPTLSEEFPAPTPYESVALTAMYATTGQCTV